MHWDANSDNELYKFSDSRMLVVRYYRTTRKIKDQWKAESLLYVRIANRRGDVHVMWQRLRIFR